MDAELITRVRELRAKATSGPFVAEPSAPMDGFECYWIRTLHGSDVASVNGPQRDNVEALACMFAASDQMADELVRLKNECDARYLAFDQMRAERDSLARAVESSGATIQQMREDHQVTWAERDTLLKSFTDACDEAGCAHDNEALLVAIGELKAERTRYADELFNLRWRCGEGPDQDGPSVFAECVALAARVKAPQPADFGLPYELQARLAEHCRTTGAEVTDVLARAVTAHLEAADEPRGMKHG